MKNFLPTQYKKDNLYKIKHNYLSEQFSDYKIILKKFEKIIKDNDFTLGIEVDKFENNKKTFKAKICSGRWKRHRRFNVKSKMFRY